MPLKAAELYFYSAYHPARRVLLFKRGLYLLVIWQLLTWLFSFRLLFSDTSVIFLKQYVTGSFADLAFLLNNYPSAAGNLVFILAAFCLSAVPLFTGKRHFFSDLLLWFLLVNLHNRVYASLTGGDYLMNQFLFFNCFLTLAPAAENRWRDLTILAERLGVMAVMLQVCLVYVVSALAKLRDDYWLDGSAAGIISGIRHYSGSLTGGGWLFAVAGYLVLAYQLAFPFLIWSSVLKKPLLIAGLLLHTYIALEVGLPGFGLIMILPYVFFWPVKRDKQKN